MRTLRFAPGTSAPSAGSIVLLPGAQQRLEEFIEAGFVRALQERALPFELILVDPQLAHLADRAWIDCLREELMPASRPGGRPLWLGGISLGAFMALRFAASGAVRVDGLCLIAPYLGSRIIAAEIARHGALRSWEPGPLADEDDERQIWRYVRSLPEQSPQLAPRVFLGLGRQDRFADTQRLLAGAVPAQSCLTLEGGHEWAVWRQLWDNFLERHLTAETA
jgi:pimeloyl-ACP methyl ester carboxylesterase